MTLYADVYFLFNFSIDLLIILLCRRILGYRRSIWRTFLAALLGALYAVVTFPFSAPAFLPMHLCFGAMLPLLACGFGNLRRFLRLLLYFFSISFFLGGAITAILRGLSIFLAADSTFHLTFVLLIIASLLGALFCLFFGNVSQRAPGTRSLTVTLQKDGNFLSFQGYADTGNLLRDPIENLPVILANAPLSQKVFAFCSDRQTPNARNFLEPGHYEGLPLRLVPVSTLTGSTLLPAIKFETQVSGVQTNVLVALNFNRHSDYCGFEALIPINLL